MKNSLAKSGLSLSQASSISNMCFQRAQEIDRKIRGVNNFSKTIKISGEVYTETAGKEIPANIVELLLEKSKLHACQAFLMENIKLKDSMLLNLKNKRFVPEINSPEEPNYVSAKLQIPIEGSKEQVAAWAREQLSIAEICEFLEEDKSPCWLISSLLFPKRFQTTQNGLTSCLQRWRGRRRGRRCRGRRSICRLQEETRKQ